MVSVPSFSIDHTTLDAGLYLRETRRLSLFSSIKVWDLRFFAPRYAFRIPLPAAHSIEHLMAYHLREILGDKYISFFIYGCSTGFGFISKASLSFEELRNALIKVIKDCVPLKSKSDIPCLTPKECGNPNCFAINKTNEILTYYLTVLNNLDSNGCFSSGSNVK